MEINPIVSILLLALVTGLTLLATVRRDAGTAAMATILTAVVGLGCWFASPTSFLAPVSAIVCGSWCWYTMAVPWEEKTFGRKIIFSLCQLPLVGLALVSSFDWMPDLLYIFVGIDGLLTLFVLVPNKVWEA